MVPMTAGALAGRRSIAQSAHLGYAAARGRQARAGNLGAADPGPARAGLESPS